MVYHILCSMRFAAKRIGKILRAAGGSESAADVVEGALAPGIDHLYPLHQSLPWHQQQQLDVIAVMVAIICLLMLAVRSSIITAMYLYYLGVVTARRLCPSLCPTPPQDFVNGPNGDAVDSACWNAYFYRCRCYCGHRSWPCLPLSILSCISSSCRRTASLCCQGPIGRMTWFLFCCCQVERDEIAEYMNDWPRGEDFRSDKRWNGMTGSDGQPNLTDSSPGIVMGPPGSAMVPPPFRLSSAAPTAAGATVTANGNGNGDTSHHHNDGHTIQPIVPNSESKRAMNMPSNNTNNNDHDIDDNDDDTTD
jgi:hypothetical protein